MKLLKYALVFSVLCFVSACATLTPQYANEQHKSIELPNSKILHSFYLIGDAGNAADSVAKNAVANFKQALAKATPNSTAVFLGDNIYPKGLPKKGTLGRKEAKAQLDAQINTVKNFKGNTIFIPGNHDWYSNGLGGLKRQEKYIEAALGKASFLPENGCPIEKVKIGKDIVLLIIDTEWYMTNWDNHPTINDKCDIKTRAKFFDELEGEIKKARGKTTLIALHHPVFTNGSHGGQYTLKSHFTPMPILGTLKNIIRKTGGVVTVDNQNKRYNAFRKRIITLAQENDKTIFVSGHDHNLQYIVEDNLPQIVSGSGSKQKETRLVGGGRFSYAAMGYARLDVFTSGDVFVRFYAKGKEVYRAQVFKQDQQKEKTEYAAPKATHQIASIYTKEETNKSNMYTWLWGKRYREDFGTPVKAPVVNLDTLFGGLTPIRKGGGHQSKSLRLEDKQKRQYVMRALKKNALQYLQAVAFKDQYIEGQFNDTFTEKFMEDMFTGSHPYAPFVTGVLSDAVGVYHTNPVLYYVPKQPALGVFANEFGDELYMIEERTDSGHGDKASFGYSNTLISTDDVLKNINKDEAIGIDEAAYIRARLFDMLIGDWDRHEDQWRWAAFEINGEMVYRPVPRDRDQAFSIMSDGALLNLATKLVPGIRLLKSYNANLKSPKWFNMEPYPLDVALIQQSDITVWDTQAKYIMTHLTDAVIDNAFAQMPPEVNQNTIKTIKEKLKGRRKHLLEISKVYYKHVNKYAIIKGTNKDDWFDIERMPEGATKVTVYRIKKGEKTDVFHERVYNRKHTKEIWIYGLDDTDRFEVFGKGDHAIKLRVIGGQNKDVYNITNGSRLLVYEHKSKANTFLTAQGRKTLTDDYETNIYDYKKLKNNANQFVPSVGFNPDDGVKIGFVNTITNYGFQRNPYSGQHKFAAGYFFATNGYDISYNGEFANVIKRLNLTVEAKFTSPNFAVNFFGFGNETLNPQAENNDLFDLDFNRVKIRTAKLAPALVKRGDLGGLFKIGISYESNEIDRTENRFVSQEGALPETVFDKQDFYGVEATYQYENHDNAAFPTLGMAFTLHTGYKNNVSTSSGFGYIIPKLAFNYKLVPKGNIVLATKLQGHFNIGDDFEFYQAATLGANSGLRGFRNERFTGHRAFAQSTDLRVNLTRVKTGLLPLYIGMYSGFDYGRVWLKNENSEQWHNAYGGGVFVNAVNMLTFNSGLFNSTDGLRFSFGLGLGF